jgi:hypothetical protein
VVLPLVDGTTVPVQPAITGPRVPIIAGSGKYLVGTNMSMTDRTLASQEANLFLIAESVNPVKLTEANYTAGATKLGGSGVLVEYPYSTFSSTSTPAFNGLSKSRRTETGFVTV